jgi:hypothetical protein
MASKCSFSELDEANHTARKFSMNVALISPPNVVLHESKKDSAKKANFTTITFLAKLVEPPSGYVLDTTMQPEYGAFLVKKQK